jgi:hypothetical protein
MTSACVVQIGQHYLGTPRGESVKFSHGPEAVESPATYGLVFKSFHRILISSTSGSLEGLNIRKML